VAARPAELEEGKSARGGGWPQTTSRRRPSAGHDKETAHGGWTKQGKGDGGMGREKSRTIMRRRRRRRRSTPTPMSPSSTPAGG
jgi:hypothetical protein